MSSTFPSQLHRAASIESYVVQVAPGFEDVAWLSAQKLPRYTDEQFRDSRTQSALTRGFSLGVPGWDEWVDVVARRFAEDGVVLVRGLSFDPENRLLIGVLASLGQVTGEGNPNLRAVYDLLPIERPPDTPDFELFFHTGSYFRARPHELLALLCVRPGSAGGGGSRLAVVDAVLSTMRQQGNEAAIDLLLRTPVLFRRPIRKGRGYFEAPILAPIDGQVGRVQVRFERRRVLRGARGREGGYSAALLAAIAAFEAAAYTPGTFVEYALQANELLIIDNRRVLHARTEVVGGAASDRHLKRVKAFLA
jgi:hypothetical protein